MPAYFKLMVMTNALCYNNEMSFLGR